MKTLFALLLTSLVIAPMTYAEPLVIAHRGASGYLPEHTREAAVLAYAQGADYIEQDLVLSKDGVLVVLHDIHLETVTDVEQQFADRKRADGRYYAIDFTLAELKTLNVNERQDDKGQQVFPNRYTGNADFRIATFEEHILLIQQLNRQLQQNVGLYPEIKAPAWHHKEGQDIAATLVGVLKKYHLNQPHSQVIVQCFDWRETQRLRRELGLKTQLVQLIAENDWQESTTDYDLLRTPEGLAEIAEVADGIGPWIPQLIDLDTLTPTGLAKRAKAQGLQIHPYTFRQDQLPQGLTSDQALHLLFDTLQVDGVFTDFTDTAVGYLERRETSNSSAN